MGCFIPLILPQVTSDVKNIHFYPVLVASKVVAFLWDK